MSYRIFNFFYDYSRKIHVFLLTTQLIIICSIGKYRFLLPKYKVLFLNLTFALSHELMKYIFERRLDSSILWWNNIEISRVDFYFIFIVNILYKWYTWNLISLSNWFHFCFHFPSIRYLPIILYNVHLYIGIWNLI